MKKALVLATLLLIITPCLALALQVQTVQAFTPDTIGLDNEASLGLPGGNNTDPKAAAISIIQYLMTFLGIIAVVIILWGGFQWLTAGGNEDKVGSAKKTIIAGVIGLIIIIAAFAIVSIVVGFATNIVGA